MRGLILAEQYSPSGRWTTTGDVARALQMTLEGVRWLVRDGQLNCTRTRSRLRLFHESDVLRLEQARAKARLAGKLPRRPKLGPRGEPYQMSFLRADLRLVKSAAAIAPTVGKGQVPSANLFRKQAAS